MSIRAIYEYSVYSLERVISRPDQGFFKDPCQDENNSTRLPYCSLFLDSLSKKN